MPILYLVRHGQASFGAADYDQLSPLGEQQALRLGQHWAARDMHFDAVYCGTLRRHQQTLAGIAQGMGSSLQAIDAPGMNEYDGEALVRALPDWQWPAVDNAEGYRQHFRLLRAGLAQWMHGTIAPAGMPSYAEWRAGIVNTLAQVQALKLPESGRVLLVTSGGPISTAVGTVLSLVPEATIDLNFRLRNGSVTELNFNPKRLQLHTFNTVSHLDDPDWPNGITYA